jgi:hypothetical protein
MTTLDARDGGAMGGTRTTRAGTTRGEGLRDAREGTRARGTMTTTTTTSLDAFDARLARARERATLAREETERVEKWLRDSAAATRRGEGSRGRRSDDDGGVRMVMASEDGVEGEEYDYGVEEERAMRSSTAMTSVARESTSSLFVPQRSPARSVIHRPIPRRPLSASVEGTEWTTLRAKATQSGGMRTNVSIVSDEDGRSAFQSLATDNRAGLDGLGDMVARTTISGGALDDRELDGGMSTPPRPHRSPLRPPVARPRNRTLSEDFSSPVRLSSSMELRYSTSSRMTLLESVAHEAEYERARMSEKSYDDSEPR